MRRNLTVKPKKGAEWKFPIKLDVIEPKPDDIIRLPGCEIGQTSVVTFDLFSSDQSSIPFTAGLVTGSSPEFTVSKTLSLCYSYYVESVFQRHFKLEPSEGELLPADEGGTKFTITYSPQIYGKKCKARFMINTPQQTVRTPIDVALTNDVMFHAIF